MTLLDTGIKNTKPLICFNVQYNIRIFKKLETMNNELEFLEEKHGDNSWGYYPPSKREVAQWLQEWTEKQFAINGVSKSLVADIRNKLTPINNLIAMIEDTNAIMLMDKDKAKFINTEIAKVKYTIEYLSNL